MSTPERPGDDVLAEGPAPTVGAAPEATVLAETGDDLAAAGTADPAAATPPAASGASTPEPQPGDVLAQRFRLDALLGQGATGRVFRAFDGMAGEAVAMKILGDRRYTPQHIERFRRELRAARRISHRCVVRLHDIFDLGGRIGLSMELVEGEDLSATLRRCGRLPADELARLAIDLAGALEAAHEVGVVHRDIKPANILVRKGTGRPVVTDFGLSRLGELAELPPSELEATELSLTREGVILGTPLYMAPEQLEGRKAVGPEADVFAVGLVLYQAATGQVPHAGPSLAALARTRLTRDTAPLASLRPDLPGTLCTVIDRCLARVPGERPANGGALRELLVAASTPAPPPAVTVPVASRRVRAAAVATILALGLLVAAAWKRGRQPVAAPVRRPEGRVAAPATRPPSPPAANPRARLGGSFAMGSEPAEIDAALAYCRRTAGAGCRRDLYAREQPVRRVTVSPFLIDRTEATRAGFAAWLDHAPDVAVRGRDVVQGGVRVARLGAESGLAHGQRFEVIGDGALPVALVTWEGARRFCAAAGGRLPSEAEWELAARGAGRRRFPWGGDEPRCAGVAVARAPGMPCAARKGPAPVASSLQDQTPEGVHDLGGNVAEWVSDAFSDRYTACGTCTDPRREGSAREDTLRVIRGGYFDEWGESARAAARSRARAGQPSANVGFRCVRDLEEGT